MSFSHFDRGDIYRLLHLNTIPEKNICFYTEDILFHLLQSMISSFFLTLFCKQL